MGILVHKYGGTSVGTTERIKHIAKRVILEKEKGNDMVVVVSAMGKTTDHLVEMSKEIAINPNKREMDLILSTVLVRSVEIPLTFFSTITSS